MAMMAQPWLKAESCRLKAEASLRALFSLFSLLPAVFRPHERSINP
jgi:hypothetical protein